MVFNCFKYSTILIENNVVSILSQLPDSDYKRPQSVVYTLMTKENQLLQTSNRDDRGPTRTVSSLDRVQYFGLSRKSVGSPGRHVNVSSLVFVDLLHVSFRCSDRDQSLSFARLAQHIRFIQQKRILETIRS